MTMGERIKYLRESHGMTQEELGEKLGVKKQAIMKYEKGLVENIKRSTIREMATLFGVDPCYIMAWDNVENKVTAEAKALDEIKFLFGKGASELLVAFLQLNQIGQEKAVQNIQDLLDVPKYNREDCVNEDC